MIRPTRDRVLVRMLGRYDDYRNPLGLELVDQQKHWQGGARRGRVVSVGAGVQSVKPDDVVIFRADAGFTMDGDSEVQNEVYGEGHRWLKVEDCFAVEEPREVSA